MTCARYFDAEFRCDDDDCYYAGSPERVAETFRYVDAEGEEREYCDVCNGEAVHSFYTCRWCRRMFCVYANVPGDPDIRELARSKGVSYQDAYKAWYECEVVGVGPTCWPCVVKLGPDDADLDSPVREMSEPERRKVFDFTWINPEDASSECTDDEATADGVCQRRCGPEAQYAYQAAYRTYREQVCAVVYRQDQERKAAERDEQRKHLKRIFPDLPEDRLRRMKRACRRADIFLDAESTTWDIACELSDYLADK